MVCFQHLSVRGRGLILRPVAPGDAEALHSGCWSVPDVMTYQNFPLHATLAASRERVRRAVLAARQRDRYLWVLTCPDSGLAGAFGTVSLQRIAPRVYRIGYALARDCWGQGYATRAAQLAMAWACDALGAGQFAACCLHTHRASARVLEKLGYQLVGTSMLPQSLPNLDRAVVRVMADYRWRGDAAIAGLFAAQVFGPEQRPPQHAQPAGQVDAAVVGHREADFLGAHDQHADIAPGDDQQLAVCIADEIDQQRHGQQHAVSQGNGR
jgi:RimJ/RimL family protein N-acetyltransferase